MVPLEVHPQWPAADVMRRLPVMNVPNQKWITFIGFVITFVIFIYFNLFYFIFFYIILIEDNLSEIFCPTII